MTFLLPLTSQKQLTSAVAREQNKKEFHLFFSPKLILVSVYHVNFQVAEGRPCIYHGNEISLTETRPVSTSLIGEDPTWERSFLRGTLKIK